jgi:hypothetical protein
VFHQQERRQRVKCATVADLRQWAWLCLIRTAPFDTGNHSVRLGDDPWNVIRRDVADGNPIFIALDRLARPMTLDVWGDPAAARVATARLSRGLVPTLSWVPDTKTPREGITFPWRLASDPRAKV